MSTLNSNSYTLLLMHTKVTVLESGKALYTSYFLGIANSCLPFLYFDALLTEMFLLDSYFLVVKLSASEGVSQSQICVSQVQ